MEKLKIALQKSGRLSEKSLELLQECGIKIASASGKLCSAASNFPLEILYLRDDDIPQYVEQQVSDIGIIGENVLVETRKKINVAEELGFSCCRLALALPKDVNYNGLSYFNGKKIATSYPNILSDFLLKNSINAEIEVISGSVEIAPSIGLADGICDIVSSGSTLISNGLKEVDKVLDSQAVIVAAPHLSPAKQQILDRLLFRIRAVRAASENKYILLNAPTAKINEIAQILPAISSPTILPLARDGWSSIHSVITEERFWEIIDRLKAAGAEGILITSIEKLIL